MEFLTGSLVARNLLPETIPDLRLVVQDEWAAVPQQLIDNLIVDRARRCENCIEARGDNIPY